MNQNLLLRQALRYAISGFKLAYDAAWTPRNDAVLRHCAHHEAAATEVLARAVEAASTDWIQAADQMPAHGQLVCKRWRRNGAVWAGVHVASPKYESFDEWVPLPP